MDLTHREFTVLVLLVAAGSTVLVIDAATTMTEAPGEHRSQEDPSHTESDDAAPGEQEEYVLGSTHEHAATTLYIGGEQAVFSGPYLGRAPHLHFHDPNGVLHLHAKGIDMGEFFAVHGITANATCLDFGLQERTYCANNTHTYRAYLNGEVLDLPADVDTPIRDQDTLVLFYGRTNTTPPVGVLDQTLPEEYRYSGRPT